jgi:aminoglycoside phosphotransferase (APT) family kinase protein
MLRPADFANLLVTVRNALATDLRPDLQSEHLRAQAGALLLILDRLITELQHGETTSADRLAQWRGIRAQMGALELGVPVPNVQTASGDGFLGSIQELVGGMYDVQYRLTRDSTFNTFLKRLGEGDARTRQWFEQTVTALVDLAEAGEPVAPQPGSQPSAPTATDESPLLRARLNKYLHSRFPALPSEPITRFKIAAGGHTKQTVMFSVVKNDFMPESLVLRRDIPLSITGTRVADEYPVLERVFALGLPVPKPILVEPDPQVLGGSFMIMSEVTDAVICGTYFPEERRGTTRTTGPDFGKEVAQLLAKLHSATRTRSMPSEQQRLVQSTHESWRALADKPPGSLSVDLGFAWLLSHPLPDNRPRCLIHGDMGTHNILVRDGHLAAMLDWELAKDADPAEDLAQCRMMLLPDVMPWEEFAREYVNAGGEPWACDSASVAWYCIWTYLKHSLMNGTLRANYLSGKRDDVIAATVTSHYVQRLMQYQSRALQLALQAGDR